MTPGPLVIKKCKFCGGNFHESTLGSGNSLGATYWTDGGCEAPMLPDDYPILVTCPHCNKFIWVKDQEIIDVIDWFALPTNIDELPELTEDDKEYKLDVAQQLEKLKHYNNIPNIVEPTAEQYMFFANTAELTQEQEILIRIKAWWLFNDQRRNSEVELKFSEEEKANLVSLEKILDESNVENILTLAEISRELGFFERSTALLEKHNLTENDFGKVILDMSRRRIATVKQVIIA